MMIDSREYDSILSCISSSEYRENIVQLVENVKCLIDESIHSAMNQVVSSRPTKGGYAIWQVGSCSRFTNDPVDFDLDFEVPFFRKQMGLRQQTVAEIINLAVINICNSNDTKACKVRRNSGINVESIVIEFEDGSNRINVDIQFHIHKQYLKEQLSAPEVIKKRIKNLSVDENRVYCPEKELEIQANIIYVKRLLKKYNCYKFNQQGQRISIGGTGVEAWLLQHSGCINEAFDAFWNASFSQDGQLIAFEDFQANYSIIPGFTNPYGGEIKKDFVQKLLKEEGWRKILSLIEAYRTNIEM